MAENVHSRERVRFDFIIWLPACNQIKIKKSGERVEHMMVKFMCGLSLKDSKQSEVCTAFCGWSGKALQIEMDYAYRL